MRHSARRCASSFARRSSGVRAWSVAGNGFASMRDS